MSDNLKIRRPQDPTKINVNESWELSYWTKALNVTADQLRTAVRAVGPGVGAVRRYLNK